MKDPPEGYEKYIWACDGCVKAIRWCIEQGKEYEVLPNKWLDETKVDKVVCYFRGVREGLTEALAEDLNKYLQTDYSLNAWSIILYEWLARYLFSLYDKYLTLRCFIDDEKTTGAEVYICRCSPCILMDHDDYIDGLGSDEYNMYQYSLLTANMEISPVMIRRVSEDTVFGEERVRGGTGQNGSVKSAIWSVWIGLGQRYHDVVAKGAGVAVALDCGMPARWITELFVKTNGRVYFAGFNYRKIRSDIFAKAEADMSWRTKPIYPSRIEDEFSSLAYKLVKRELPLIYAEKHGELKKRLFDNWCTMENTSCFIHGANTLLGVEGMKVACALMHERGAHICTVQIGGELRC